MYPQFEKRHKKGFKRNVVIAHTNFMNFSSMTLLFFLYNIALSSKLGQGVVKYAYLTFIVPCKK